VVQTPTKPTGNHDQRQLVLRRAAGRHDLPQPAGLQILAQIPNPTEAPGQ
jgi:hypothetical protein